MGASREYIGWGTGPWASERSWGLDLIEVLPDGAQANGAVGGVVVTPTLAVGVTGLNGRIGLGVVSQITSNIIHVAGVFGTASVSDTVEVAGNSWVFVWPPVVGTGAVGRAFVWGLVEGNNARNCDVIWVKIET